MSKWELMGMIFSIIGFILMIFILRLGYHFKSIGKKKLSKLCFLIAWIIIFPVVLISMILSGDPIWTRDKKAKNE